MERQIQKGDFVYVSRSCCNARILRATYVVERIESYSGPGNCSACGAAIPDGAYAGQKEGNGHPISWLRRIHPLSELEEHKEETHA